MKKIPPSVKKYLSVSIVVATALLFAVYFIKHPELRHALANTNPWMLILIGALYFVFLACLVWVYDITIRLCGKRIPAKENILLTCYSTIANFFGPLQSGPGVRAVYLWKKHDIKLLDYTLASLVYYALYAIVSAWFLLIGSGHYWPWATALLICVTAGSLGIVWFARRKFAQKSKGHTITLEPKLLAELFVATILQLAVWALIFYVELQAIHANASLTQAIVYGGTANFAVFVAMTPGAIGFREAFLNFTQKLHGIGTAGILAASVIDRSVYVVFLGLLFLLILLLHADRRFRVELDQPGND